MDDNDIPPSEQTDKPVSSGFMACLRHLDSIDLSTGGEFWKNSDGTYMEAVRKDQVHGKLGPNQVAFDAWKGPKIGQLSSDQEQATLQIVRAAYHVHGDTVMGRIAAAQAIQESGWGITSNLARKNKNLFGIKGSGTAGTASMLTREEVKHCDYHIMANFAANDTFEDSFQQHAALLQTDRYRNVREATNFADAATALSRDGYATDSNYAHGLISIDQRLDLMWTQVRQERPVASLKNTVWEGIRSTLFGDNNTPADKPVPVASTKPAAPAGAPSTA